MNENNKHYPTQKVIGAMFPEHYQTELVDKLKAEHGPDASMAHMVRALLARWFNGEIKITKSQLRAYSMHLTKRQKFMPRGSKLDKAIRIAGYEAAGDGQPRNGNPYPADDFNHVAWDRGWCSWFTQHV